MYTAKQLSRLFHCSVETIRLQSIEFQNYLTPRSNPGEQRTRHYSDEDVRIFAYIHEQKRAGRLYADIAAGLANGERADPPDNMSMIVETELTRASSLQSKIAILQSEINRLQGIEKRNIELEALLEDKTHQIEYLQNKVDSLNRKIGKLEAEKGDNQ